MAVPNTARNTQAFSKGQTPHPAPTRSAATSSGLFNGPDGRWELPAGAPPPAIAPFDTAKAKELQEAWAKYLGVPIEVTNLIGMKLVLIPPGEFAMGDGQERRWVRLTKPFYLGKYEVTEEEWESVMGKNNPSQLQGRRIPVSLASWEDGHTFQCDMFLSKLSLKCGRADGDYRLPTEAQWEYACQAGSTGPYCFGDTETMLDDYAWYIKNSGNSIHPVGQKKPNAWGLHDMHGNVLERCADWYDQDYYKVSPLSDPTGPISGTFRVGRGGSWSLDAGLCQSQNRHFINPGRRDTGLRAVLVVADEPDRRRHAPDAQAQP